MTIPKRSGFYSTPKASEYEVIQKEVLPDKKRALFEKFSIVSELGRGSFGKVYMALLEPQGILCAVKQINVVPGEKGEAVLREAEREVALLTLMRHVNIVNLIGQSRTKDHLNIFMHLVPGNSLDVLKKSRRQRGESPLSEPIVCSYMRQILVGLIYCHGKGVIHRDLKGKNILLADGGIIKIADFGSGKEMQFSAGAQEDMTASSTFNYTILWVAPEVVDGKSRYNAKCDIWALGCVAVELANGEDPWYEKKFQRPMEVVRELTMTDNLPRMRDGMSPEYYDFCKLCLTRNVEKRPHAQDLYSHPWFQKWDKHDFRREGEMVKIPASPGGMGTPTSGPPMNLLSPQDLDRIRKQATEMAAQGVDPSQVPLNIELEINKVLEAARAAALRAVDAASPTMPVINPSPPGSAALVVLPSPTPSPAASADEPMSAVEIPQPTPPRPSVGTPPIASAAGSPPVMMVDDLLLPPVPPPVIVPADKGHLIATPTPMRGGSGASVSSSTGGDHAMGVPSPVAPLRATPSPSFLPPLPAGPALTNRRPTAPGPSTPAFSATPPSKGSPSTISPLPPTGRSSGAQPSPVILPSAAAQPPALKLPPSVGAAPVAAAAIHQSISPPVLDASPPIFLPSKPTASHIPILVRPQPNRPSTADKAIFRPSTAAVSQPAAKGTVAKPSTPLEEKRISTPASPPSIPDKFMQMFSPKSGKSKEVSKDKEKDKKKPKGKEESKIPILAKPSKSPGQAPDAGKKTKK